ncbi:MAG: hypothetical protein JG782_1265 [Anaerophaga sp.]|nr:hypothetical protein [Anaerophaga sp.]MDI3520883.1 hypothetical protein [Anaerophaga sp.]MDN5290625.1 hypothetical protein [Anaerophaga sp.]
MQSKYSAIEWQKKRREILQRDNFTCQMCNTFNPSLGMVEIVDKKKGVVELHEYESNPWGSLYRLSSSDTGQTITMNFNDNWLVLPILQIHHVKYTEGNEIWEYEDNDLITLCKFCHTKVHEQFEIPMYDKSGKLVGKKKFQPENFSSGRNHNYKPWTFIKFNSNKEYQVANVVKPTIEFFGFAYENSVEIQKQANKMCKEFFDKYLPDYSQ